MFNVKQKENEPLRSYIKRFTTATLEVPITSEEILVSALVQGLREGEFFKNLSLEPPSTFNALLEKAEKYINLEDAQRAKKEERPTALEGKKENRMDDTRRMDQPRGRERGNERRGGPRYDLYTPLVGPVSQILVAIEDHPLLRWPRSHNTAPRRDPSGNSC